MVKGASYSLVTMAVFFSFLNLGMRYVDSWGAIEYGLLYLGGVLVGLVYLLANHTARHVLGRW